MFCAEQIRLRCQRCVHMFDPVANSASCIAAAVCLVSLHSRPTVWVQPLPACALARQTLGRRYQGSKHEQSHVHPSTRGFSA
jgi:hypothetical protein